MHSGAFVYRRCLLSKSKYDEQFLVIAGQLAVCRLAEIAGVRFLSVYQQHGRANLAAVLQDRHLQERQRGRHVPAAVGVQTAGMVSFIISPQLRKLRRQFLRYQQAEIVYSLSHKKLFELASDAGAIYRFDSTVLINRDIFDAYLERFHEPARKITAEEVEDE